MGTGEVLRYSWSSTTTTWGDPLMRGISGTWSCVWCQYVYCNSSTSAPFGSAGLWTPRRPCGAAGSELNPNGCSGVVDQADHGGVRPCGAALEERPWASIIPRVASRRAPTCRRRPHSMPPSRACPGRAPRRATHAWPWPPTPGKKGTCTCCRALLCRARDVTWANQPTVRGGTREERGMQQPPRVFVFPPPCDYAGRLNWRHSLFAVQVTHSVLICFHSLVWFDWSLLLCLV